MSETPYCGWAPVSDKLYRDYHDTEWGVPERDPRALWEKLQLDGMQAGLSWITILRKRGSIREEFDLFDPERLARWTPARVATAMENPGIIRSSKKIEAVIGNARAYLDMMARGEDFADYCWEWVGGEPVAGNWKNFREAPTFTDWSEAMSKDLKKRGFKFVGPTIVYAWAQAVGMVNDHEVSCPRHREVRKIK
ncbi:MAG: DNA-3-methyladenine glycosylase I [Hyphomonas sp.]|uniref:DNA-3-methyladenine glycosylase I n=1 Tax=Hyphomonas sp. TaxID=87 RepID=UPI001829BE28|nr:DNA-3-methyladenine glycosylase I [Hyphomonas sp.]MBA3067088.1 DNA-3-methyladenine glycosylase I [Hyphomonas sp.]MBU3919851.1 DNA-3-methyladenine glycosylase I [Alphaproteobacteria bacterium]MBU4063116.1 DNA-3-methyladenine glycosylase I [Alphaproteobacteria bacterium]MBU4164433.1 DNA-3-methyladenine glycosylase I [Alphaproteobacteria bacterium]